MSEWIDITLPMDESMIVWRDRPRPARRWEKSMRSGDHCNASSWDLSAHSGTHMDAPLHFVADGKSIDQVPLDVFMGPCQVLDLCQLGVSVLDEQVIRPYVGVKRLLVRSNQSARLPEPNYLPHEGVFTPAAARLLVEGGLVLIGTDRLSIDDSQGRQFELHHIFLGSGCVIIEGLQLAGIAPGSYTLHAAPLRMVGAEASPVRAMLRRE